MSQLSAAVSAHQCPASAEFCRAWAVGRLASLPVAVESGLSALAGAHALAKPPALLEASRCARRVSCNDGLNCNCGGSALRKGTGTGTGTGTVCTAHGTARRRVVYFCRCRVVVFLLSLERHTGLTSTFRATFSTRVLDMRELSPTNGEWTAFKMIQWTMSMKACA